MHHGPTRLLEVRELNSENRENELISPDISKTNEAFAFSEIASRIWILNIELSLSFYNHTDNAFEICVIELFRLAWIF